MDFIQRSATSHWRRARKKTKSLRPGASTPIEKRAGIGRARARKAVDRLLSDKQLLQRGVRALNGKMRQIFTLSHSAHPHLIFLPNAFINGATGEDSPIERLRIANSMPALQMMVDIYDTQDMAGSSGLDWTEIRGQYDRKLIRDFGAFNVWGFNSTNQTASTNCALRKRFGKLTRESNDAFWSAFTILERTSLIESVRHIVDMVPLSILDSNHRIPRKTTHRQNRP